MVYRQIYQCFKWLAHRALSDRLGDNPDKLVN